MTTYILFVVRNCSKNSEIDNSFWGENNGKLIEFEDQPTVGQKVEIPGTQYENYVPVNIHRYSEPHKLFVEAKSV